LAILRLGQRRRVRRRFELEVQFRFADGDPVPGLEFVTTRHFSIDQGAPSAVVVVEGGLALRNRNSAVPPRHGRVGKPHRAVEPSADDGLLPVAERELGATIGPAENSQSKAHG
jgi:hypothetical protein